MSSYKISEAARATGFTESALRFYEQESVVVPDRTETGYRTYRDDDLESLRFVARGKQLGLSLNEITELLDLLRDDECEPVQTRMRHLMTNRIEAAQRQIGDLVALTAQLQATASRFATHTPEGACDDECGCRVDSPTSDGAQWKAVSLGGENASSVACSLEPGLVGGRIDDWRAVVDQAVGRDALADGIRLRFSRDLDVAALSQLAADEQTCCGFFIFNIGIHPDSVTLEVSGPEDAQQVISAMFGSAA